MPRIPGHPLLGHLRTFNRERTEMLLRVGREQPEIASLRFGFVPCAIVSSPAIAHEMLATKPHAFVKSPGLAIFMRPLLGNGLLSSEHEVHAKQRKLLAPVFAHKRIASYAATMGERGARYASSLVHGAEIDAADDMMKLTLEIVGKTLFDTELGADSADEVGDALTIAMKTAMAQLSSLVPLPPSVPTPTNLKNRKAVARLDAILYRIIQQRRAQGGDRGDLLSMLLATQDESGAGMSDRQVRDEAMTLFLAGHETTANAMAWTLYLLAQHAEVRERLEAELDALGHDPSYEELRELPYTLAVLKESMRLYPPAYMLARRAIQDVELGGHRLRKHTIVILNVLGIHRRPDTFPDPDRFDPTRFLGDAERSLPRCAYMPFGAGPRICIGNHFALMEGHVLLATLARRVRLDLVGQADATMEPLVTLRPKGGIRMRVSVREAGRSS
ncbi:MAG: cytochrome P450 [Deltaproteobacteria bacterium]|nr:cytochrome P450 [Deltaproteobacteria bacterium]